VPITRNEYKKITQKQAIGKAVVTVEPMRNAHAEVAVGTRGIIVGKFNGYEIKTGPCPHCGVQLYLRGIPASFLEFVPKLP